jgi:ADP-ribose pyrophosphatase YjhB (NUDIX family)
VFCDEHVLLIRRGTEPLKGLWSLPGGAVEAGERLEAAISRELSEETGLTCRAVCIAEVFERLMRDPEGKAEYHYVLVDFVCEVTGGTLRPGSDVDEVRWVPVSELSGVELTEGTQMVIERVFPRRHRLGPMPLGIDH